MPNNNKLFREPDENTGPAFMGKEPMVLPEHRKKMVQNMKNAVNNNY